MSTPQTGSHDMRENILLTEKTQGEDELQPDHDKENDILPTSVPVVSVSHCITNTSLSKTDTDIVLDVNTYSNCYLDLNVTHRKVIKLQTNRPNSVAISAWQYDDRKPLVSELMTTTQLPVSYLYEKTHIVGIYILSNKVVILFKQLSSNESMLTVKFTAVNMSDIPDLEIRHVSQYQGFTKWQHISEPSDSLSSCTTLVVPKDHYLFVTDNSSVLGGIRAGTECVVGGCEPGHSSYKLQGKFRPWILPDDFDLDWTTAEKYRNGGMPVSVSPNKDRRIQLVYSFQRHKPLYLFQYKPKKSGRYSKWNCSQSVWPGLYLHFPCDMEADCVEDEDETHCAYYSDECGPGKITIADSCLFWFSSRRQTSLAECKKKGGLVASFGSSQQLDIVYTFLMAYDHMYKPATFMLDLHPTPTSKETSEDLYIRNMYVNTWQWGTGHIAYNLHYSLTCTRCWWHRKLTPIAFLNVPAAAWSNSITMACSETKSTLVMCRNPAVSSTSSGDKIIMDTHMDMTASSVPLITCSLRHVTHVTLACDPQSLCSGKVERRGVLHTPMCLISVTHITPYFRCQLIYSQHTGKSEETNVPYSVVCDWSPDCADNSDESFCQFPLCRKTP